MYLNFQNCSFFSSELLYFSFKFVSSSFKDRFSLCTEAISSFNVSTSLKQVETSCSKLKTWIESAERSCNTHLPYDAGVTLLQEQVQVLERLSEEVVTKQETMSDVAKAIGEEGREDVNILAEKLQR